MNNTNVLISIVIILFIVFAYIYATQSGIINNAKDEHKWEVGEWGQCSSPCGLSTKKRSVVCKDKSGKISNKCNNAIKPIDTENCVVEPCSLWKASAWGECSAKCGKGTKVRTVECLGFNGKNGNCKESTKPILQEDCQVQECGKWIVSDWSNCYPSCGDGTRTRLIDCVASDGSSIDTCPQEEKPILMEKCTNVEKCGGWLVGAWSECTAKCGGGKQTREISCRNADGKNSTSCTEAAPNTEQICNTMPCGSWKIGEWQTCTKLCDGGVQYRNVTCTDPSGKELPIVNCHTEKPIDKQPCNEKKCEISL